MTVLHDRTGERIEEEDQAVEEARAVHSRRCRGGWIDRNADRPVPCLVCKPHLARTLDERQEVRR